MKFILVSSPLKYKNPPNQNNSHFYLQQEDFLKKNNLQTLPLPQIQTLPMNPIKIRKQKNTDTTLKVLKAETLVTAQAWLPQTSLFKIHRQKIFQI